MPTVVIDGIEYVPRAEVPELTDERLKMALKELVSIQYFRQEHKAIPQAWNVLDTLAPARRRQPGSRLRAHPWSRIGQHQ